MANGNGLPKPHYVKFEREWRDSAKKTLSNAQWWKVAGAVVDYFLDEEEPELPEKAKLVFETLRPQLDYRRRKSVEQLGCNQAMASKNSKVLPESQNDSETALLQNLGVEMRSTCGSDATHRAVAVQLPSNHLAPIDTDRDIEVSSSSSFGTNSKEGVKAHAPTLNEVRAYCEHCNMVVSPEKFFNYYDANDWLDKRGRPIGDWRAKLNAWNQREGRFPEKARTADARNSGNRRMGLKIGLVTSAGDEGMWYIQSPLKHAGPIPGSKGMSRDEAEGLAVELHPDLGVLA